MDNWLNEIKEERARQVEKWGEQNHHPLLWFSIIGEEYGEMCQHFNNYTFDCEAIRIEEVKKEAVQIAATCVAMLESIERKQKQGKLPGNERNGGVLF